MLLFHSQFHKGLIDGSITLTFRLWPKPRVRPGGRYRCHPIGVLEVDSVERMRASDISDAEVLRAGFVNRAALHAYLERVLLRPLASDIEVFRVALRFVGDGDRSPLGLEDRLSDADVADIATKLAKLDKRSDEGPWTASTLALIAENPHVAASHLAKEVGREKAPFKADVVKLKKLGLTQSFEVGYEVSPRGRAYLDRTGR